MKIMKLLSKLVFIILLSFGQFVAAQNLEDFKKIEVTKYTFKPNKEFKLLTIPASFGSSQLANSFLLDSLKDKKVASVRLVYTKYRESESFDQEQLNKKRVANLVASNPKLFSNACIKWYRVEQTTEDSFQAKSLFHGFYILYQNKPPQRDYAISDKLLNQNVIAAQTFKIRNHKDTTITGKEGTQVAIPSNCFLDENKKTYKGEVKMEVKEAITMESIILGNLVTMADGNALESGGMIYIDAKTKDGKTLSIKPGKTLEVNVPSKQVNSDMKLWEAENNGKFMNWKNPQPLMGKDSLVKGKTLAADADVPQIAVFDFNNFDPVREMGSISTLYNDSQLMDYRYTIYSNGKIKVEIFNSALRSKKIFEKLIDDTMYNALPFHNKKILLPIPYAGKKIGLPRYYFKNNFFEWDAVQFSKFQNKTEYKFNFSEIGTWANIDRLANDPATKPVAFSATLPKKDSYTEISMYLIFKDKKMFIPGYKSEKFDGYGFSHGDFEIPKLPVGAKATVLCIAYKKDIPYYALQNIVISEKQEVILKPVASSDDAIKKLIADSF